MQTAVTAERLWDGTSLHQHPLILIEDGRIDFIATRESSELPAGARVLDYPEPPSDRRSSTCTFMALQGTT